MWEATIMWVLTMKPVMGSSAAGYHRAMVMARYRDVMTVDATSAVGDDPSHGAIVTSHVTERLGP